MNEIKNEEKKFPKGHFVGIWMGIGVAVFTVIGIVICVITENFGLIGVGPAMGTAVGLAVGQSIESKYAKQGKIRPLNALEISKRKTATLLGFVLFLLGILVLALIYFRVVNL